MEEEIRKAKERNENLNFDLQTIIDEGDALDGKILIEKINILRNVERMVEVKDFTPAKILGLMEVVKELQRRHSLDVAGLMMQQKTVTVLNARINLLKKEIEEFKKTEHEVRKILSFIPNDKLPVMIENLIKYLDI